MSTLSNVTLNLTAPKGQFPTAAEFSSDRKAALAKIARFFDACAGGMEPGQPGETKIQSCIGSTDAAAAEASGTVTFSGASGTVGAVIGGITKTQAHGASDDADATNLAAAINADSTLNKYLTASAATNVVTVTAKQRGAIGNLISLVASGTGVTVGAARLAGGVGGNGTPTEVNF